MENSRQTKMIRLLAFIFTLISINGLYISFSNHDTKMGIMALVMLTVCGLAFWHLGKSKLERGEPDAFLAKIKENEKYILLGGWEYNGNKITKETELTQFIFTFSLVTISFKIPSRFYVVDQENTFLVNFLYTSMNIILGWWAIPMGPIYTAQSLFTNLNGGNKISVESLLNA